jgi:hypothetical protein
VTVLAACSIRRIAFLARQKVQSRKKLKVRKLYLLGIIRAFRRSHVNIEYLFRDPTMKAQVFFCEEVHSIFRSVRDVIEDDHQKDIYPFFLRAYSHWESSVRLWASGRIPEAYCLLRASLETMSYAYVLREESSKGLTLEDWLKRDQDEDAHRKKFTWGAIVSGVPNDLQNHIRYLYKESIVKGAHPNPDAITCGNSGNIVVYQGAHLNVMVQASMSLILAGILYLETFSRLYPETFVRRKATDRILKLTELFQKYINSLTVNIAALREEFSALKKSV